jgi:hypothetical protein
MVPFVGSHDVPRFTSRADSGTNDEWNQWQEAGLPGQPGNDLPYQAALQAYAWLLTTPGAPLIYQGDEYGEFGGADPDNRHMWRNNSNINNRELALMENISAIAQLRKDSDALRRGSYESLTNSTDTIAWSMTISSDQAVVAMNRGENPAGFDLELNWVANDSLNGIVMDENHSFTLGPHAVAIFLQPHDNNSSPIQGCTNSSATNYNPLAEVDDGSCQYSSPPVEGCTNSSATNYNPLAEIDDGSCQYPSPPVEGCTNSSATNYNPLAEIDDGSCTFTNPVNNNTNQTGNQSSNSSGNESSNQTENQTNPDDETIEEENNTNSDNDAGENNQDSTTETGGVDRANFVVYALLIILVLAIIGFVMISIRRP